MQFFKPKISDYERLKPFLQTDELTCENLYLNALIWNDVYQYEFAYFDEETIIIRLFENGGFIYLLPLGKSFYDALNAIIKLLGENDHLTASDGKRLEKLKEFLGEKINLIPSEENFDYIYSTEDLAYLQGKKYHQKRNHISAFTRKFNWRYETLTDDNINDVFKVATAWVKERADSGDEDILIELDSIKEILPHHKKLDIIGGVLYVDEEPVAFAFGSPINDKIFDVTTEKALSDYPGAYSVINNEFAKHEMLGSFEMLNREDDLGIEGLRRAKRSYNPIILLKKYLVEIKKP